MSEKKPRFELAKNFLIGGLSGMTATSCIQPLDMIKVRIQILSESRADSLSPFKVAKNIYKDEGGVKAFYKGIDAALLRQAVYATLRLGIYFNMTAHVRENFNNGANLSGFQKIYCSLIAGAIGSFIGTPCDLALVRFQVDPMLPVEERRNYKHVFDALRRVIGEEGIANCWNGASPTIVRAIAMNVSMLATYDEAKERLTKSFPHLGQKPKLMIASMISAVFCSTASLPFDNVKTKLQKQQQNPDGTWPYKGFIDCGLKTFAREGVRGYWAGLPTYYFRVGPHAIITLLTSEILRKLLF